MSKEPPKLQHLSSAELESMVMRLGGNRKTIRFEAERVVRQAGVKAIGPLVTVLHRESHAQRKRQRIGMGAMLFSILCFTVELSLPYGYGDAAVWIGIVAVLFGLLLLVCHIHPSRLQKQVATMLMGIEDLRAIGPLIDVLRDPLMAESEKVRSLLVPLLYRLRSSDSALIEPRHHDHFHNVLKGWDHYRFGPLCGTDYIVAILTALRQVGDGRDLPFVERIAYPDGTLRGLDAGLHWLRKAYNAFEEFMDGRYIRPVDQSRIVRAALECLPYLQQKAQQQVSNSLLRASAPRAGTSDVLLRPADSAAASETQQLLRASLLTEAEGIQE